MNPNLTNAIVCTAETYEEIATMQKISYDKNYKLFGQILVIWVKLIIHFFQIAVNPNLTNAIVCTGETYEEIAKMVDDQPRNDWEPLGDMMHDYRGMLAGWPSVLQIHAVSFFVV